MRVSTIALIASLFLSAGFAVAQTTAPATKPAGPPNATPTSAGPAQAGGSGSAKSSAGKNEEAATKQKCGSDQVVWGNAGSKIYHTSESRYYGKTNAGSFMCLKDAQAAGFHASKGSPTHAKKPAGAS